MNVSDIILQFARACKQAQNELNEEGTGGASGNVPILIKEAEFKYNIECSVNFENSTALSVNIFRAKIQNTTTFSTNTTTGLDLRLLFVSEMVLTSETVADAK